MKNKIAKVLFILIFIGSSVPAILLNIRNIVPGVEDSPELLLYSPPAIILIIMGTIIPIIILVNILKVFKKASGQTQLSQLEQLNSKRNFQSLVSNAGKNQDAVKTELMRFKTIKKIELAGPTSLDLIVVHQDDSEHNYRANIIGTPDNFQILDLKRYS